MRIIMIDDKINKQYKKYIKYVSDFNKCTLYMLQ